MILEKVELNEKDVDSDLETVAEVAKKSKIDFSPEDVQIIDVSRPSQSARDTISDCPRFEDIESQNSDDGNPLIIPSANYKTASSELGGAQFPNKRQKR